MKKKSISALLALSVFLAFLSQGVVSANQETANLARAYSFKVKSGSEQAFDKAFAEHVQWRRDNKDPWDWEVYVAVNGPNLGQRVARSFPHTWSDFDSYYNSDFWKKAHAHWLKHVAQYVEWEGANIGKVHFDLGHWADDAPDYRYFQVVENRLKVGKAWQYRKAVKGVGTALKEAEWEGHWAIDERVAGGYDGTIYLVVPFESWADMQEPDPGVYEVVVDSVGEEKAKELFDSIDSAIARRTVTVYEHLPQLSIEGAM